MADFSLKNSIEQWLHIHQDEFLVPGGCDVTASFHTDSDNSSEKAVVDFVFFKDTPHELFVQIELWSQGSADITWFESNQNNSILCTYHKFTTEQELLDLLDAQNARWQLRNQPLP